MASASTSASTSNPLVTTKAPEAALGVQLHPLVLLTITDYITRHTSRQQRHPIVGAIIGQQNGRNFTLEHAYECKTIARDGELAVDAEWFADRLEQYKDVHKAPALDLVAIFMLGPVAGPGASHVGIVSEVQKMTASEGIMLLLFHPEMVEALQGGKLPITLYESVQDQQDGGEAELRFRELTFEVETGEAEMIGVDFVATGGGNATAVPAATSTSPQSAAAGESSSTATAAASKDKKTKTKGKGKDTSEDANGVTTNVLSPEDEELIASLTAKANAIKMLNQRLNLIRSYLQTLPTSYLTDASSTDPPQETNHTLLRSITAMLSRLPLLAPPSSSTASANGDTSEISITSPAASASQKEQTDVHLTSLLATLTRSISEAQSMGSKFAVVSKEKAARERGGNRFGFGDGGQLLAGDTGGF